MQLGFAIFVSSMLMAIAAVHVYWAFGGAWPASERAELPQTVVGTQGSHMPKKAVTLAVAFMIFLAALVPLIWTRVLPVLLPQALQVLALWGLVAIFLGRGLVTYTPLADHYSTVEPFRTLDRKYYSPLCLLLGLSLMGVAL